MNRPWEPPSRNPGAGAGAEGSVRAARERMDAGLPPAMQAPQPRRLYEPPRLAPQATPIPSQPPSRIRPPMPVAISGPKKGQVPVGVATSRPTQQAPQWPLAGSIEPIQQYQPPMNRGQPPQRPLAGSIEQAQQYQPPMNRGPPPQRPPRPSQVPSIAEIARLQGGLPTAGYAQRQEQLDREYEHERERREDDMISPAITSPMTTSSRESTQSSVGSIPDFPIPLPPPPRRSANLGPPPSSRRGASSYYSQATFVSPIPEESPRSRMTHLSYASSAAIPTSWGSDSPRSEYGEEDYENESLYEAGFDRWPANGEGQEARISADDGDDTGLIRSASFGRKGKASMVTTKGTEKKEIRPDPMPQQRPIQMSKLEKMGVLHMSGQEDSGAMARNRTGLEASEPQRQAAWPIIGDATSPLATGTGFIDKSSSSSEESVPTLARAITTNTATPVYGANSANPNANTMLGAYNAASSLQPPGTLPSRTPSPSNAFGRLSAMRRPPRLDIDAVREAEARGSLTSLPDLILRATRLASMIDRGKRPGSRLALDDFPSEDDFAREKEMGMMNGEKTRRSGFSGMLASFPQAGLQTPLDTPTRPMSAWPSVFDPANAGQDGQKPKKPRRCCGLPCWGFLLVFFILLIIIAAAVVVPLELLVLNKPQPASTTVTAAQCQANVVTACQNGGTALVESGNCACVCTNGFTGSTCTSANATGCATVDMPGSSFTNVTLGQSISRLIQAGPTNFSIPLIESTILARFNSANLSCATENALVTFQGRSERMVAVNHLVFSTTGTTSSSAASGTHARRQDHAASTSSSTSPVATSSNGIVFDGSSPAPSDPATNTNGSGNSDLITNPSPAPGTSNNKPNPLASFKVTEEVLDFARITVLYVLQQDALENAITAQSTMQKLFHKQGFTNQAAMNISIGHGNLINLVAFQISVGGAGFIGGRNSSLTVRDLEAGDEQLVVDFEELENARREIDRRKEDRRRRRSSGFLFLDLW